MGSSSLIAVIIQQRTCRGLLERGLLEPAGLCRVVAESPSLVTDQGAPKEIAPLGHVDAFALRYLLSEISDAGSATMTGKAGRSGDEKISFAPRGADPRDQKTMTRSALRALTLSLALT